MAGARSAQELLDRLRPAFGLGTYPGILKEALRLQGFDCGGARRPVAPMSEENNGRLRDILTEMGLL